MSIKNSIIIWLKDHQDSIPRSIIKSIGIVGNSFGYKTRYGKEFYQTYQSLKETEYLSKAELDAIALDKLKKQIRYAYEHVPFYKELYQGIDLDDIRCFEDLSNLPIIDKATVRQAGDRIISDEYKNVSLVLKRTSGSTGMPLALYMTPDTTLKEWAFVVHIWERLGYKPNSSRLIMSEVSDKSKGAYFYDFLKNGLHIDISSMSDTNMKKYCQAIEKYKPDFVHGYPSAILQLCHYIEKNPIKHQFRGVLTSSEGISEEESRYICRVLNCKILSFYGHTERLVIAGQCECSQYYHVEPLYGFCELVDSNCNAITDEGITGEIVATGFCNKAMPLIRYRTGDLAQWSKEKCECGRNYRILKKLDGRTAEYLVDANGTKISVTSYRFSFIKNHVKAFQFYQDTPGKVIFRIIPDSDFSDSDDTQYICKTLSEDSNGRIEFIVEKVNALSQKKNGKREIVVQKL